MHIPFGRSQQRTIGIEWELACIDPDTRELAPRGPEVVARVPDAGTSYPQATQEFLTNTVEIVSSPYRTVGGAVRELSGMLRSALANASAIGVELASAGSHPFSLARDQAVTPGKQRYTEFVERMGWWGRAMLIWGLHVHVALPSPDRAIAVQNALLTYLPHLQALAASSPYWEGVDTGYASNRAMIFQQATTGGLPPLLDNWAHFERHVDDMVRAGIAQDHTELRWDIRPAPTWGTLEVRISDAPTTVWELAAVAALTHCLVEHLSRRIERGEKVEVLQPAYTRENKWRSARYGLQCLVISDRAGTQVPLVDDIRRLLEELAPVARELGCENELLSVQRILRAGPGSARQRRVAAANDGDLRAVVDDLVRELRGGGPG